MLNKMVPRIIGAQINFLNLFSSQAAGKKAFDVFCTPRKGRIRTKDRDFLETCDSEQVLTGGPEKIQTYIWNEEGERTVLLIHGWESNTARWRFLIPYLVDEGYKVVSLDAPAHGGSEGKLLNVPKYAAAIDLVVDAFQPDHLIGHSVGGMSVIYFLEKYGPKSVKSVAVLGALAQLPPIIAGYKKMLGLTDGSVRSMDKYLEGRFGFPIAYFQTEIFKRAHKMQMLIVHDQKDRICPPEGALYNHRHFPHSELFFTEGLGHGLQDKKVFDKIVEYLRPGKSLNGKDRTDARPLVNGNELLPHV